MNIKTSHGNFKVRDLPFADRRKLHRLEIQAVSSNGEITHDKYFDILEWVMNFAFEKPEKQLGKFDDNIVDEILGSIYQEYKDLSKKKT